MRQHRVRGVAGGADRGDGQPLLEETHAVDRVGVVLRGCSPAGCLRNSETSVPSLWQPPQSSGTFILATGDFGVGRRQDDVRAVAGDAGRRQLVAARRGLAVQAGVLQGRDPAVAGVAGGERVAAALRARAAGGSRRRRPRPCRRSTLAWMPRAARATWSSWQEEQSTVATSSSWPSPLPVRSAWQSTQASSACLDLASLSPSTKAEISLPSRVAVRVSSEWQARHSSAVCAAAGTAQAAAASSSARARRPRRDARFELRSRGVLKGVLSGRQRAQDLGVRFLFGEDACGRSRSPARSRRRSRSRGRRRGSASSQATGRGRCGSDRCPR